MTAVLSQWYARRSWFSVGRPAAVLHGHLVALALPARSFTRALVATPFQLVSLLPRPEKKTSSRLRL